MQITAHSDYTKFRLNLIDQTGTEAGEYYGISILIPQGVEICTQNKYEIQGQTTIQNAIITHLVCPIVL